MKKITKLYITLIMMSLFVFSFAAFASAATKTLASISANVSNLSVNVGSSITNAGTIVLTAKYSDGSTSVVTNYATWKISDTSIANLPGNGTIKGLKAGSTTLTLMYGGKSTTITIKVVSAKTLTSISANVRNLSVNVGGSITNAGTIVLTAKYSDGSTAVVTNDATWKIGDNTIANLPGNGTIKGIKAGSTTLTLSYGGKSTTITITIIAGELSGVAWCSKYPTSISISKLSTKNGFQSNVQKFVTALQNVGATVNISATVRPKERAYLMYYAWMVAKGSIKASDVPAYPGVNIIWNHADEVNAAKQMVSTYGIVAKPSLTSNHISGLAIDMNISWTASNSKPIYIKDASGNIHTITASKSASSEPNSTLMKIGTSYGVFHLVGDPPHWSYDGK